jgi:DNA-directed RNA polymerase subunit RPC12/RpoP
MYDENEVVEQIACPHCGAYLDLNDEVTGRIECTFCGGHILIVDDSDDAEVIIPEVVYSAPLKKRRRGWKNFFAIIIGMLGGLLVRTVLVIPLSLLFATEEGLPQDIMLLLELFTAFIAGAIAASLVPRLGWLFGLLTQTLKFVFTAIILAAGVYLAATDPDVEFNLLTLLRAPVIRSMLFSIVCAVIAGAIAEKYREKILSFLGSTFGMITSGFGCLLHSSFLLFELYFLYLGGKAIFADGKVLKGLAIVIFIGPIASYAIGAILIGIVMGIFWIFSKIYNAYAEDLDIDPI